MGAHSTINITRSKAKELFLAKLLGDISDEELEDFMDKILDERLYNCNIVPDDCENDDCLV
jgi:hypothetical protein